MRSFTFKCKMALCLFAGFILTVLAVNSIDNTFMRTGEIEGPHDHLLTKLSYVKEHKNEFSVLFVGASRTYHGIDPVYFDSLVGKKIPGIKSYNFGAPGLGWAEILYTLNFINELDPPNLKYIIFEPIPYSSIHADDLETRETWRVHDLKSTLSVLKVVTKSDEPKIAVLYHVYFHLLSFLRRATCTGCIINYYSNKIEQANNSDPMEVYDDISLNAGFIALDDDRPSRRIENEEFMLRASKQMPILETKLVQRFEKTEKSPDKSNDADSKIISLAEVARRSKAEPIMIVTPQLFNNNRIEGRTDYIEKLSGLKVWAYNDPRKYPEFLKAENRWEERHLNKKGAHIFTEKLAEDFIKTFSVK